MLHLIDINAMGLVNDSLWFCSMAGPSPIYSRACYLRPAPEICTLTASRQFLVETIVHALAVTGEIIAPRERTAGRRSELAWKTLPWNTLPWKTLP